MIRHVAVLITLAAGLPFTAAPAPALADVTCQGLPVTGATGTDGPDVLSVASGTYDIHAGGGDDIVCVVGSGQGRVDGGTGLDSIQILPRTATSEGRLTLVDFERFDVTTDMNLGTVQLVWTATPSELAGSVEGLGYDNPRRSKSVDDARLEVVAPGQVLLDLRHDLLSLGQGLDLELTEFMNVAVWSRKVRLFGDEQNNRIGVTGCDVVARGGPGHDLMGAGDVKRGSRCPGARLYGQQGNDTMFGTRRNDVLIGGPDRDRAHADGGRQDRCSAEHEYDCER